MDRKEEQRLEQLSPFEVKNTLIKLAKSSRHHAMINAGRGNPNWVATTPREAFFLLGQFALEESQRSEYVGAGFGGICDREGVESRFATYLSKHDSDGGRFLLSALGICVSRLGLKADDVLVEWVDGILGDNYPVPDRILACTEAIVAAYLRQEMAAGDVPPPEGEFDYFAVEGGTAAMVYLMNSLKTNGFLRAGDRIAMGVPIFTPYIELPELEDYQLESVDLEADEMNGWQMPESELEKLRDPSIRAFFLVNPSNPPSVSLSDDSLRKIAEIASERGDLLLVTDDVYGTFTDGFTSLATVAPHQTLLVYSYSKYFGATGWRLGVIGLHQDNIFDRLLQEQDASSKERLRKRYQGISLDPDKLRFIDRIVADSRAVALNHTAGLSTPQQIQMSLFSLFSLSDWGAGYKQEAKRIVRSRYKALYERLEAKPLVSLDDPNGAFYYSEIDIRIIATRRHGEEFFEWMKENFEPLDFIIRLAQESAIVVMPGAGFDAPDWSLRVSLANLYTAQYLELSEGIEAMLQEYYDAYRAATGK
jgi:aspartate 4-decarboxylase